MHRARSEPSGSGERRAAGTRVVLRDAERDLQQLLGVDRRRGSQVFTDTGKSTRYTRLFSSTETGTVAPQWEASSADHAYYQLVASAETNDRHFTLYQKDDPAGSNDRFATLEAYRSNSSQPAWSYGFPVPIYNHDRMMVECSRDGSVVAVVIENVYNSGEEVYVFDGTGGQPLHFQANMAGWFKYGRLSDDGSTLYLNSESRVKLFDTSTGNELHSMTVFGGTYTGHAISADGRVFAFSRGGGAVAYSRDAVASTRSTRTLRGVRPST